MTHKVFYKPCSDHRHRKACIHASTQLQYTCTRVKHCSMHAWYTRSQCWRHAHNANGYVVCISWLLSYQIKFVVLKRRKKLFFERGKGGGTKFVALRLGSFLNILSLDLFTTATWAKRNPLINSPYFLRSIISGGQFKMASTPSGRPICASPTLRGLLSAVFMKLFQLY